MPHCEEHSGVVAELKNQRAYLEKISNRIDWILSIVFTTLGGLVVELVVLVLKH